jgi:hypothetical protein
MQQISSEKARFREWSPHGFDAYRALYPASPALRERAGADATEAFAAAWDDPALRGRLGAPGVGYVFVRGIFGAWIPGHLREPLRAVRRAGADAIVVKSHPNGTIDANADAIARDIEARVPRTHKLVFLCHSKGGLDALAMLLRAGGLRERTACVVLCQTPRGGCAVLESVVLRRHQASIGSTRRLAQERLAHAAIALGGAREACIELTADAIGRLITAIDAARVSIPILSVASWSGEPTAWLDSQHARLSAIRPGAAHDGLFFTEDLIWPIGEQILLPSLDHSQPSVGGAGFDHGRFWLALAALAASRLR